MVQDAALVNTLGETKKNAYPTVGESHSILSSGLRMFLCPAVLLLAFCLLDPSISGGIGLKSPARSSLSPRCSIKFGMLY